ncbi:uncharacterized protein LOC586555 [Strongylocentrotus purpuratus]|uniref:Uncharacterized protein n=1 Tax=Strongylocentrotus purpuratus TaxID=7668 RepID=A0A7M7RFV5_STRPU|nr:uncharacterized protein LOC586555 [Strongylocentrotus purpuratus]|eukprot:XP_800397.1 PREDICTED: uncharacterized protein LOC586555 [Strongylocentrotus purpuratus]
MLSEAGTCGRLEPDRFGSTKNLFIKLSSAATISYTRSSSMMSTTLSCQWLLISIGTVLIIPAINLASAGITRHRGSMSLDKRGGHYQPSSSDSTSSSSSHIHDHQVEQEEHDFVSENRTSPSLPLIQDGGEIMLPRGFKIIALDEDDTPFIIIPNMHHILENNSDLTKLLKSALREAHRNKRSPSTNEASSSRSSSPQSVCRFEYRTTVLREGHCVRFGDFPACLSGDQMYPYARDCVGRRNFG